MKFIECKQGTPEWHAARAGLITASCFADAVSTIGGLTAQQECYVTLIRAGAEPKAALVEAGYKAAPTAECVKRALAGESTEQSSDTAKRYAADLAIERISGQPHGEPPKAWVLERGHEMEAHARRFYEGRTGSFVTEAGICVTDDGIFGYSTDGLVDDDGLIEIKAPIDSTKILAMWRTGDTSEYDHQMQGGMWITGRKWVDFIMYVPDLVAVGRDLFVKRVFRDEAFIDAMVERLATFDDLARTYEGVLRGPQAEAQIEPQIIPEIIPTPELATVTPLPARVEPAPAERGAPTMRLGHINERLAPVAVTADGLARIGFEPAATEKAAKLYHEQDFPAMCAALIAHIAAAAQARAA